MSIMFILLGTMFNAFSGDIPQLESFETFQKWEKNFKSKAKFHSNYKVPDYLILGLRNSDPESAYGRYLFLKNNPQYAEDYERIHKGELTSYPTDGSTLIRSRVEDMPPHIAKYYTENPKALLAAEGFNTDPVLSRMLYTGEIKLPYGTNATEWLRTHAWTPQGIVEKNNVVDNAQTEYRGYVLNKIDPATGKPIEPPTTGTADQVKGLLVMLSSIQKDMATIISKAQIVKESLSLSLASGDFESASIDCSSTIRSSFKGRCNELKVLKKSYSTLNENAEKIKTIISGLDKTIAFPKIALDTSALSSTINKSNKDIFAADKNTPDCSAPLQGWKCLKTTITTLEGKSYNIFLKWNRPLKKSRGTVFYGVGGTGTDESVVQDPKFKAEVDQLDQEDNVRFVYLLMLDKDTVNPISSGYWSHGGGYESLAQVFMAILELGIKENIFHGNFLNYTGGSNGTMMISSAMSRFNADIYFDRAVLHAGPFLPNLTTACDRSSQSNFYLSNANQVSIIEDFLSRWAFKDPAKKVCENQTPDRLSLLGKGLKNEYPNTRIHVIMGQKEVTDGFGHWILASNKEWYESIAAKSKERIVHQDIGHEYSYKDVRRLLKLGPDEI